MFGLIQMDKAKLVMAFGSFDLLHPGHLLYLRRARSLAIGSWWWLQGTAA